MTDYKALFRVDWVTWTLPTCPVVFDVDGKRVPAEDVAALLNAHARLSAQRCETCRYAGGVHKAMQLRECSSPVWVGCFPPEWKYKIPVAIGGCTAHQPKEDA